MVINKTERYIGNDKYIIADHKEVAVYLTKFIENIIRDTCEMSDSFNDFIRNYTVNGNYNGSNSYFIRFESRLDSRDSMGMHTGSRVVNFCELTITFYKGYTEFKYSPLNCSSASLFQIFNSLFTFLKDMKKPVIKDNWLGAYLFVKTSTGDVRNFCYPNSELDELLDFITIKNYNRFYQIKRFDL